MDDHLNVEPAGGRSESVNGARDSSPATETEQSYRWLLDHSPVGICVHVEGRYVYVNEALVRSLAAESADQLLGRRVNDFVHPDSLAAVQEYIAARGYEGQATPALEIKVLDRMGGWGPTHM